MRRSNLLLAIGCCFALAQSAFADGTTTDVGEFRSKEGTIKFSVVRNSQFLTGVSIGCYDEHAIESVNFWRLGRPDLEKLRSLIDATLQEMNK